MPSIDECSLPRSCSTRPDAFAPNHALHVGSRGTANRVAWYVLATFAAATGFRRFFTCCAPRLSADRQWARPIGLSTWTMRRSTTSAITAICEHDHGIVRTPAGERGEARGRLRAPRTSTLRQRSRAVSPTSRTQPKPNPVRRTTPRSGGTVSDRQLRGRDLDSGECRGDRPRLHGLGAAGAEAPTTKVRTAFAVERLSPTPPSRATLEHYPSPIRSGTSCRGTVAMPAGDSDTANRAS